MQGGESSLSQEEGLGLAKVRGSLVSPETYEGNENLTQAVRLGHKAQFSLELISEKPMKFYCHLHLSVDWQGFLCFICSDVILVYD